MQVVFRPDRCKLVGAVRLVQVFHNPRNCFVQSIREAKPFLAKLISSRGRRFGELTPTTPANDEGDELPDRPIGRHAPQTALEQPSRGRVVGHDAGQVDRWAALLVQLVKEFITLPDDRRSAATRHVEPQAAEVADCASAGR